MKKTLFLLFVVITVSSCGHGGDPIDPVQTYSVRNSCDENILVEYSLSAKIAHYFKNDSTDLDTIMVAPNEVRYFTFGKYRSITETSFFPSEIFSDIRVIVGKDTLSYTPIQDDQWECTETINDYGYIVVDHHWLLDVNK